MASAWQINCSGKEGKIRTSTIGWAVGRVREDGDLLGYGCGRTGERGQILVIFKVDIDRIC